MTVRASKPKPMPATARGAATRARIIAAAADLVFTRGVGGTSLDDVMDASATSKSQLYHYFADKDALVRAVIQLQFARVLGFTASHLDRARSLADLRPWRDAVVGIAVTKGGAGGCPVGSLASQLADHSEGAREVLAECFSQWEACVAASLGRLRDDGHLDAEANPADLAAAAMAALQGGLLMTQATRSVRPLELALDMALDHVGRHRARAAGDPGQASVAARLSR